MVPLMTNADVAQLAEQLICNQQVIGSSPIIGFMCTIGRSTYGVPGNAKHSRISDARVSHNMNGWIPEWPKGTDCKSAANCFGGSNPPPPILL